MPLSTVQAIDDKFRSRLTRPDKLMGRPVNPFATLGSQNSNTKNIEALIQPKIFTTNKVGAEYNGNIVDAKFGKSVHFDGYSVLTNPSAGHVLHSTKRMKIEHTREK